VAWDDRDVAEPGVSRDRFLSEFALALVEGVELQEFLDWSVAQIGRILGVDRLTLFLFEAGARMAGAALAVRTSWAADGITAAPAMLPVPESLLSAHLAKFESLVAEDVFQEPALAESEASLRLLGTKSLLAVPVGIDGVLRGFVAAATVRERRVWTPDDVAFVESAAHHLSAAFKQTELVEELGRERDRLSVLFDLASAVQRSTTVSDVVETALSGLRDTLLFPVGVFSLIAPEGDAVVALGGYGDADPGGFSGRIPLTPERPTVSFRVLESGQPLIVNEVEEEPEGPSKDRYRQLGARSFGVFPMRSAGKTIGVMSVASRETPRRIEFDDIETLQSLADFVGVALEQRRSAHAVAEAMREARTLADASHVLLTRTADRRVLLGQILDALALHFGHEACSLLLVDQERHVLVQIGRRGLWWHPVDPVSVIPLDAPGLIPLAARSGRVVNAPDVAREPDYVVGWVDARSELVVPLILDDRVVGVFDLQSGRPNAFSDADARTIRSFAERAALALRLSELVGTLENRTRVLEAVTRATQLLNFRLHAPDVLASIVEETTRAFPGADGCVAWVCDAAGTQLSVAAADGVGEITLLAAGSSSHPLMQLKCAGRAFLENRPAFTQVSGFDDLSSGWDPEARARARAAVENAEVHSLMAVPIRVGDHRLGVLEVLAIGRDAFTPEDGETLALLAEQSAIALRNARLIEELQRSNRLKDDFLANLSHEIRTPLTGIVGWAEVLLDSHKDDAAARRALEAILGQADTLSRMLADLIDLSRIDNFGLELRRRRVAVPEILAAALDAVSPGARRKGVAIRCALDPDLPPLEGDAVRLKQVLWNLLTNGVKFSPAGGTVHVFGRRVPGGGLEIAVEDEGHGIDPKFLPLVFDRFRQEETSSNRRFGGLGIGLAIARAIVLAHGGTIVAESEGRERGSRFRVTFPADRVVARSEDLPRDKHEAAR
jgi:signal transduction histidine kinase